MQTNNLRSDFLDRFNYNCFHSSIYLFITRLDLSDQIMDYFFLEIQHVKSDQVCSGSIYNKTCLKRPLNDRQNKL